MTNQELLDLLVQLPPEDLSHDQLELLRKRLQTEPAFAHLLVDELQMGSCVEAAMNRLGTTLQEVRQVPPATTPFIANSVWLAVAFVAVVLLLAFGTAGWWETQRQAKEVTQLPEEVEEDNDAAIPEPPSKQDVPTTDDKKNTDNKQTVDEPTPPSTTTVQPADPTPPVTTKPEPNEDSVTNDGPKPWDAALAQQKIPAFHEIAFQEFDFNRFVPRSNDLKDWLVRVKRGARSVRDVDSRYGKCAQFEGVAQLVSPWPEDGGLRFSLEQYNRLQFHFFRGEQGVTLVYHEDQQARWMAYATTRVTDASAPATYTLTGGDDYRNWRTEIAYGGPYELRYLDGEIILSRGDIVLVRAPLAGPPEEVFLEGKATIYGLEIVRSKDFPPRPEPPPTLPKLPLPAQWKWQARPPQDAQLAITGPEFLVDDSIRFAADPPLEQRCEIFAPLPGEGFREVELQIENPSAGASVYLGRSDGTPTQFIRFMHNRRMDSLQVQMRGWDDEVNGEDRSLKERPTAAVGTNMFWLKLRFGLGNVSWAVSSDGVHWGMADFPHDWHSTDASTLGMQVVARQKCGLMIKQIRVRELRGLSDLVDEELHDRAIAVVAANDMKVWREEINKQWPEDISESDWELGCAIRSLEGGISRQVAYPLTEIVLDNALERRVPLEKMLAALDDVGILALEYRGKASFKKGLAERYFELPQYYPDASFAIVWKHWQEIPLTSDWAERLQQLPIFMADLKQELLEGITLRPGVETAQFLERARFYHLDQHEPLVAWAAHLAGSKSNSGNTNVRESWHHPFVEELSKETYNFTAELVAVLDSDATDDAARLITRTDFSDLAGLTPARDDPRLLQSAKVALLNVLRNHPAVQRSLVQRFDSLAALRQQAAATANDATLMRDVSFQFAGTSGSAAAYKWLGDRALVEGWFESAVGCYEAALGNASSALQKEIQPRLRLAGAMCGREIGSHVTQPVTIGTADFSPAEFEKLIEELREQAAGQGNSAVSFSAAEPLKSVPAPQSYKPEVRDPLDGPAGDRHNEEGARHVNHFKLDWVDRQLGAAVEGDRLYVSNRFQLAAYSLNSGTRKWRTEPSGMKNQRAQTRALIAARPLILADRILVRHLYGENFGLMSVHKATGKLQWATAATENEPIVSDPFLVRGQVVVLTGVIDAQDFRLHWTVLNPETGTAQQQHELLRLRQSWLQRPSAEVQVLEDGIVVQLAGCVLSCDALGSLQWVRQEVYTPDEEDRQWVLQQYQKPLVVDQQLFVAQPGVPAITCLDRGTGRTTWTRVLASATGILGFDDQHLIISTEEGLAALDASSGEELWRESVAEMHPAKLVGNGQILSLERERIDPGKENRRNVLVWREAATGQRIGTAPLAGLDRNDPRMGLLVPHQDQLWTFFGENQSDPNRRLVELVPQGEENLERP